jgi:cytochrome c biogenesis protein CcmG, thiol:disulfide interchange protein DsbE
MHFLKYIRKFVFLTLLFLSIINTHLLAQENILKINQPAPTFVLKSLENKYVYLRDFCGELRPPTKNKKQHVVIVSFFASWCKPCLKEIVELKKILANFCNTNLKLFLIDLKENKSVVDKFVRQYNLPGTVLLDKYGVAAKKYGVTTLPRLFVINKNGLLVWKTKGYQTNLVDEITIVLKKVLNN